MFRTKFDRRAQQEADTAIIHPTEICRSDHERTAANETAPNYLLKYMSFDYSLNKKRNA
jgi:hypothetical protein